MFGILVSAFNLVLAWLIRSVLVKFFVFFALYFITSEFIVFVIEMLPNSTSVDGALAGIGSATWFFLDVFQVQAGLAMVVSAYATRFTIRRIPIIG
ncbi:MAG: DUF2523 family protein [Paenalcaligenes sp.]